MELRFDFATDDATTGFRLERFELYNWGTYDKKIVSLEMGRENALLTGDIGSGKSTIVDALTTLLVPHQKIIYNKAAGANTKERTLYSYIVGEYKATQDEDFGFSKAVALRDESSFSVLLGRFENIGFEESVSLAQFFWIKQKKVYKFFVVSKGELSIKKDFIPTFNDVRGLKRRLRELPHTVVFDTFSDYFKSFGREMGIKNEQALNLFYQTVSLKSIGNLTEFIRTHMLEDVKLDEKVDELCQNFATLNHTHDLIVEAQEQIDLLKPIKKEYGRYADASTNYDLYTTMRNGLNLYFSFFEEELLTKKLEDLEVQKAKASSKKQIQQKTLDAIDEKIVNIKLELQKNGFDRINSIETQIRQFGEHLRFAKQQNETYNALVKKLGLKAVSNEHTFLTTKQNVSKKFVNIEQEKTRYQNEISIDSVAKQRYKEEMDEVEVEIVYLKNNPSNIPHKISKIRDQMARSLGVELSQLPFVGELINVTDTKWQGAIERVLHNTALSLLVAKEYYEEVSAYVEQTDLKGKLVYLKVDTKKEGQFFDQSVPNSLLDKIEIKADTPYFNVLNSLLHERFEIACVDSLSDFRRYKKALTINGQFKSNLVRHEKDDRFDIEDRSRWILGWDNLAKLEEFEKRLEDVEQKHTFVAARIANNQAELKKIDEQRDTLRDILQFESFERIDWYRYSKEIEKLEQEKDALEKSSDIIQTLQKSLEDTQLEQREHKQKAEELVSKVAKLEEQIEQKQLDLGRVKLIQENGTLDEELKEQLDAIKEEVLQKDLTLATLSSEKTKLREHLQNKIDKFSKILQATTSKIATMQSTFIAKFPVISKEFGVGVEYAQEFLKKLDDLQKDNLPKWKGKFKQLLKESTIRDIVMFQTTLEKNASDIQTKIDTINRSLRDIEYSEGTYIELKAEGSKIKDIKEFRQTLKQIISGAIDENNEYDEQKFLQIKELIARFNGREGYSDVDKKWRKLVIDVRNWFDFSAIERYVSDGSIKEFYAHSGGKSGGQKEKLAYTVLASSLAFQFGLEHNRIKSRSFRFVMIDEAFGRGSDESTRYALELFKKLRLQLLIITPKQKINVIEPYVKSVHFVHNQDGMDSSLISLSIEEYQNKKQS
ncbi:MAG: ATP-dependent exonuclease SbcCD, C subunit-like protein [Epsilonproteobacteria bacterium]|nr:ATP-dependent exonuclease SbcCD, C subunit-like protein [Campylobacterota bacterium]